MKSGSVFEEKFNSKGISRFEESYFEGYYKGIGDFSEKRDRELANWFRAIFDFINNYYPLEKGKGKSLIEFGCATGIASKLLRDYGWKVTATDISEYAVKKAAKNFPGIKFQVQDMENLFKGEKFNVALAFDVIEHLPHPLLGIKNVYSLLKSGGVAIFTTPNDYSHVYNDPTHINVKEPQEWRKIFEEVGFREIFIKQFAIFPYFYRLSPKLAFIIPFAVNFKYVISPVLIIAKK